jgi:hypothetical protein
LFKVSDGIHEIMSSFEMEIKFHMSKVEFRVSEKF